MITQDSAKALSQILLDSLKHVSGNLYVDREIQIFPLPHKSNIKAEEFYLVTISSHIFHMFVLLHFSLSEQMRHDIAARIGKVATEINMEKCYDYLGEICNIFSGSIKRVLNESVTHLGMSVPSRLVEPSLAYVDELKFEHEAHARITFAEETLVYGSIFVRAHKEFKIRAQEKLVVETQKDLGELELF